MEAPTFSFSSRQISFAKWSLVIDFSPFISFVDNLWKTGIVYFHLQEYQFKLRSTGFVFKSAT